MDKKQKIEILLYRYYDQIQKLNQYGYDYQIEYPLYCLLSKYKGELPDIDDNFHKAFRQMDITDSGFVDSAIHTLLGASKIFWPIFVEVKNI